MIPTPVKAADVEYGFDVYQPLSLRKGEDAENADILDGDYIEALESGMPPTGGMGIGTDRIIMMLTGQDSIREIILFPTLKKLEEEK